MKINRLQFSIDIKAKKVVIWEALWNENSYQEWTSVFTKGSYTVTDNWKEGSKVYFLAPDKSGIYSLITKHLPNKLMQFKHIGLVTNGKEQPLDDETKKWTGATESYQLLDEEHSVRLKIEIDVMDEHLEFMQNTFPKALEIIKNKCV